MSDVVPLPPAAERIGLKARRLFDYKPNADSSHPAQAGQRARDGGQPDLVTEDAAALEFEERFRNQLLFDHDRGSWFRWSGACWRRDPTGIAFRCARELARELADGEPAKSRCIIEKTSFATGVEKFCWHAEAFAVTSEGWDLEPLSLGTPGGTVDLRSGKMRAADPRDRISKLTAVAPAETANCPRWLNFLDQATAGDAGLIRFLRQWAGYALTGEVSEHALVFVYGPGGNGKSVFLNVLAGILSEYATTAAMGTLTTSRIPSF